MSKLLATLAVCLLCSSIGLAQGTRPQVSSVKGFTFDNDTGAFSQENVFVDGFPGLWNQTQIDAVLVIVEVTGEPYGSYARKTDKKYKVQLTARGSKVSTQTRPIVTLGENGKRFAAFVVPHDWCITSTLTAKVIGPGPSEPVVVSLPANCGE